MAIEQKFVFSENVLLRCRCVNNDYIPIEMVDLNDIVTRVKEMLTESIAWRRCSSVPTTPPKKISTESFAHALKERLSPETRRGNNTLRSRSTEKLGETNSVVLTCSPMVKRRKQLNRYSTGMIPNINHSERSIYKDTLVRNGENKTKYLDDTIQCLHDNPSDYVHIATFDFVQDAELFLSRLIETNKTVALEIDVSGNNLITISYQQLLNFKQDFMMLNLKSDEFMLFLRPF